MSNWHSKAVMAAVNGLEHYSDELDLDGNVPEAAKLLSELRVSSDQLLLSNSLLRVASLHPTPAHFRSWLAALAENQVCREYLAIGFARDWLPRAEQGVTRLSRLASVLPYADPPRRSSERLGAAALMYLAGFDLGCIALCRAVVEVLVEEFAAPEEVQEKVGSTIARLRDHGTRDHRKLSQRQAADMFFINEQAREVLHDGAAGQPLDPLGCLEHLARLLSDLHPNGLRR